MSARRGRTPSISLLALCAGLAIAAAQGPGIVPPPDLGLAEAELRSRFGEALRVEPVTRPKSVYDQIAEAGAGDEGDVSSAPHDPFAHQQRLVRPAEGDVERVEYDLFRERVYRTRWRLASRFERPVLEAVALHLGARLGEPDYDQTLHAPLGSGRSDLRRIGWNVGTRALELRQLHPFTGGPMFLSLADLEAAAAIVDAGGTLLPQPESTGEWWRRPARAPSIPTAAERDALAAAVATLVDSMLPPRS